MLPGQNKAAPSTMEPNKKIRPTPGQSRKSRGKRSKHPPRPKATAKKAAGAKKFSKCQKKTMKSMFNMTQIKCFPSG